MPWIYIIYRWAFLRSTPGVFGTPPSPSSMAIPPGAAMVPGVRIFSWYFRCNTAIQITASLGRRLYQWRGGSLLPGAGLENFLSTESRIFYSSWVIKSKNTKLHSPSAKYSSCCLSSWISFFFLRLKSLDVSWRRHGGDPSQWGWLRKPTATADADVGNGRDGPRCRDGRDRAAFCRRPNVPTQLPNVLSSPRATTLVNC